TMSGFFRSCGFGLAGMLLFAMPVHAGSSICNVPKPDDSVSEFRARIQPSVPDGYTEQPFVETAPEPWLTPADKERGFLLFQRPITEPVYPNTRPLPHERLEGLSAFAALGEFESVTFCIYPVRELKNLKVRCSTLENGEAKISGDDVVLRLGTYWNIGYPTYTSRKTYRRMPELLEQVTVHSSSALECQRYWITIHVPMDAKPGIYTGTVTLWDDGFGEAVKIPLCLRVAGFELLKDPAKHSSAYYYIGGYAEHTGKSEEDVRESLDNDYRAMVDYGMDAFPTVYLDYKDGRILLSKHPEEIDRMFAAGLKGPIPLVGDDAIMKIYEELVPGGIYKKHWLVNKMPPDSFYEKLTELFRTLREECETKGLPEMVCAPIDEVAASHKEFGIKVFAAVKAAGFRTFATKDPKAADAEGYRPYLDIWCSQPFSVSYKEITSQSRYEYWCYPNHNACEIRDPLTMCKGGRMTYGFGLWRSGFTTLIPWHWSWLKGPEGCDYLGDPNYAGCGNRIDDQNRIMPAIYWECFREGWDDGRYLYTLQQAVYERTGSEDQECAKAVAFAKRLLQKMWDDIHVQQKYMSTGMWPSGEFNARRQLLSRAIEQLVAFPAMRKGQAPSVLVGNTVPKAQAGDETTAILEKALKDGKVERRDIGGDFSQWYNGSAEGQVEATRKAGLDGRDGLRWRVKVDHRRENGKEGGDWPVGWPLTAKSFSSGELDMSGYDYLSLMVRVDSDRDEVADDRTPLEVKVRSHDSKELYQTMPDLGDVQREWIPLRFSIKEMMAAANQGVDPWRNISRIYLILYEKYYAHGTDITFDVADVSLLRFKKPLISKMDFPGYLSIPQNWLPVAFEVMGADLKGQERYIVSATIGDERRHRIVSRKKQDLADGEMIVLDMSELKPGKYEVELKITDKAGAVYSEKTQPLFLIDHGQ
ncbi:MAG: hypothetical protein ABFR33_11255, partial [Verrucomicrobiota bacterium]